MVDTASAPPPRGLVRTLLLRALVVLVLAAIVVGVRYILTGKISEGGMRLLLIGFGAGIFGGFGIGADLAGTRMPSVFAVVGRVFGLLGAVLVTVGVVFSLWETVWLWRFVGACFPLAFGGMRGALLAALDVSGSALAMRRLALVATTVSMTIAALAWYISMPPTMWKIWSIALLVEGGAVVATLALRASQRARSADASATDATSKDASSKDTPPA